MFGYREADSTQLKELKRKYDRAVRRIKCLEANLARIDYSEFDALMDELERTEVEARDLYNAVWKLERVEDLAVIVKEQL